MDERLEKVLKRAKNAYDNNVSYNNDDVTVIADKTKGGLKRVSYHPKGARQRIVMIEQNPNKTSDAAQKKREGKDVIQIIVEQAEWRSRGFVGCNIDNNLNIYPGRDSKVNLETLEK